MELSIATIQIKKIFKPHFYTKEKKDIFFFNFHFPEDKYLFLRNLSLTFPFKRGMDYNPNMADTWSVDQSWFIMVWNWKYAFYFKSCY